MRPTVLGGGHFVGDEGIVETVGLGVAVPCNGGGLVVSCLDDQSTGLVWAFRGVVVGVGGQFQWIAARGTSAGRHRKTASIEGWIQSDFSSFKSKLMNKIDNMFSFFKQFLSVCWWKINYNSWFIILIIIKHGNYKQCEWIFNCVNSVLNWKALFINYNAFLHFFTFNFHPICIKYWKLFNYFNEKTAFFMLKKAPQIYQF